MKLRLHDLLSAPADDASQTPRLCAGVHEECRKVLDRRTSLLPVPDQELLYRYFVDDVPVQRLATDLGCSRRSVNRRLHALLQRLSHPAYQYLHREGKFLSRADTAIARSLFCEGQSIRHAARTHGVTIYAVRLVRTRVLALSRARNVVAGAAA